LGLCAQREVMEEEGKKGNGDDWDERGQACQLDFFMGEFLDLCALFLLFFFYFPFPPLTSLLSLFCFSDSIEG